MARCFCFRRARNRGKRSTGSSRSVGAVRYLELTGWAAGAGVKPWGRGRPGDASLPVQRSRDFNDLVAYVEAVRPKQVYTVFGFQDLAEHLRRKGYSAIHLGKNATQADRAFQMPLL